MKKQDHLLLQRVAEGDVTRKEFDQFQSRLREEPALMEIFQSYSVLHHTLIEEFEGMPLRRITGRKVMAGNSWWAVGSLAAAAAVALIVAVQWMGSPKNEPVVAAPSEVEFSEDAIWNSKGGLQLVDGVWRIEDGSELSLIQGRAKLLLSDHAEAVVTGPSELRMDNPENLFLKQGRGFFRLTDGNASLSVRTPSLKAIDLGTAFAISANRGKPDEVHVLEGKVRLEVGGVVSGSDLAAGDGARVDSEAKVERFEVTGNDFPTDLGRPEILIGGPLKSEDWRVGKGAPEIRYGVMSGTGFEVFRSVPSLAQAGDDSVILATMEVLEPEDGNFHTENWAGLSFFTEGEEIMFFGDSYGDERTWSLDLRQGEPVVLPEIFRPGARKVTLRYDALSGEVSLHEGGLPLREPFCRGRLGRGLKFDSVRIGAAEGASVVVKSAEVRVIR